MRKSKRELSHKDIRFLKAVAEVEDDPKKYIGSNKTAVPANTSVLRGILDMTETELKYRMQPNRRGFEEMGLLELHEPVHAEDGLSPRAVSLTEQGRKKIIDWEKRHGEIDPDDWNQSTVEGIEIEISQLRSEVDRLESELARRERAENSEETDAEDFQQLREDIQVLTSRVDAIAEKVEEFDEDGWGAVEGRQLEAIKRGLTITSRYESLFKALGISDPTEDPPTEAFEDEEAAERVRESVREALGVPAAPGEETTTPPERGTPDKQDQREIPPDQPVDELGLQNDGSSSG